MADTKISQLPAASPLTGAETVPIVQGGGTVQTTVAQIAAKAATTSGITALTGDVSASGTGTATATLAPTGVTAGTYSNPSVTIDAKGRVTAASNGAASGGITTLTGDVTASGTGSAAATLANTAVTAGSYTNANITVDAKGRITSAANGTSSSGGITSITGDATAGSNGVLTVTKINGIAPGAAGGPILSDSSNRLPAAQLPQTATTALATANAATLPRVNLAGIGDSWMFLNGGGQANYRFNNGPVNQAVAFTNERFGWQASNNLGVSGDTALGIYNRRAQLAALIATRPTEEWDLVVKVGVNDARAGITVASYTSNYIAFLKYAIAIGFRNIYIMSEVGYPYGYNSGSGAESSAAHDAAVALIKQYNASIAAYAATQDNLWFADAYAAYGGDTPTWPQNGDIHPGIAGAQIIAKILAANMIAARGKRSTPYGNALGMNPTLAGTAGNDPDGFAMQYASGNTLGRDGQGFTVSLNGGNNFSYYTALGTGEVYNDTLMPGDIIVAVLDKETTAVTGASSTAGAIGASFGTTLSNGVNLWALADSSGYADFTQPVGRQVFYSDPYVVPTVGVTGQPYLKVECSPNCTITEKIYEASTRRIFATPNAQYSASATVGAARNNIAAMTATATGPIALTLRPLAQYADGTLLVFYDGENNAATNAVTIKGNGSETIVPLSATTGSNTLARIFHR